MTNKETCGEYYQENYMNYDEETHSLLSLNDLRPVHFVNAKQGGLLAHPRNMQHTSRSIHGKAKNCTLISEEWDFHSLRHTHATILYEALIQKRLGHINIQTTKRYTDHVTKKMLSMLDEVINGDNIDNNLE